MSPARGLQVRALRDMALALLRDAGERAHDQRRALFAFAIRVASAAIGYLVQVLLARWMGTFEYGVYAYVWIWVMMLGVFANLGFSGSVMRFVPQYLEHGDGARLRGVIARSQFVSFALPTALAMAGAAALYAFADVVTSYYVLPLFLATICLPMYTLSGTLDGLGRSFGWLDAALIPPYIVRPFLLLGFMAVAIVMTDAPSAVDAVAATIAATWVAAIGQYFMLRRRMGKIVADGPKAHDMGNWVGVSLPFMFMEGCYLLMSHTDILVLDLYRSPEAIAVYFAAVKTTSLIAFVHFAVVSVVTPKFAQRHAAGRQQELGALLQDAARWIFWPSVAASACLLVIGWPLLWLFGPDFTAAYPVLFILVSALIVRAAMGPADALLNMMGHQKITLIALVGATLANLGLNFLLIPGFGLYGAAAATALSLTLYSVALFVIVRKRLGLHSCIFGAEKSATPAGLAAEANR